MRHEWTFDKKAWNGTGERLHEGQSRHGASITRAYLQEVVSAPQEFWALVPHFISDRYVYTSKIWSAVLKNGQHGAKKAPCCADFLACVNGVLVLI